MAVRTLSVSAFDTLLAPATLLDVSGGRSASAEQEPWAADEIPTSTGCMRGFFWAIGIETATALCVYGAWRLWTIL